METTPEQTWLHKLKTYVYSYVLSNYEINSILKWYDYDVKDKTSQYFKRELFLDDNELLIWLIREELPFKRVFDNFDEDLSDGFFAIYLIDGNHFKIIDNKISQATKTTKLIEVIEWT